MPYIPQRDRSVWHPALVLCFSPSLLCSTASIALLSNSKDTLRYLSSTEPDYEWNEKAPYLCFTPSRKKSPKFGVKILTLVRWTHLENSIFQLIQNLFVWRLLDQKTQRIYLWKFNYWFRFKFAVTNFHDRLMTGFEVSHNFSTFS